MNKLALAFTEHPASVGESYFGHMGMAIGFGVRMLCCGVACLIHAVLPFLFVRTGSNTITRLHDTMVVNRNCALQQAAANENGQRGAEVTAAAQSSH